MTSPAPETRIASHLKWFGRTDRGKFRPNNEDAFLGIQFDLRELRRLGQVGQSPIGQSNLAFAVCDGMGGAKAGEFASRVAVEKITALLPRSFRHTSSHSDLGGREALADLYRQIHQALTHLGDSYPECRGMETTLSLCWFTPARMFFAHIGDSRIYHLPAGQNSLSQLSEDDTHVGWLRRQRQLNEREARQHPRRKVLQKALGGDHQFVVPQLGVTLYQTGDIFLLCTDGVIEGLYDHHLVEVLRRHGPKSSKHNPADMLVEESIHKDGHDNATAVVIQVA